MQGLQNDILTCDFPFSGAHMPTVNSYLTSSLYLETAMKDFFCMPWNIFKLYQEFDLELLINQENKNVF